MKKGFKKQKKTETVEEFLSRGGIIQTEIEPYKTGLTQTVSDLELKKFYNSNAWKKLRKEAYDNLVHFCPVCGSEEKLNVDHINPVRYFWEQRLDINNLQILCEECNLEKGSMVGWSIEYHIKNRDKLQQKKKKRTLLIEELVNKKENKKANEGLSTTERDTLQRAYSSYRTRCFNAKLLPVTKYLFRKYVEEHHNIFSWINFDGVKPFIKNHFREFRPPEKFQEFENPQKIT